MTIKEHIDQDLKTALLGGDKVLATTLRGLKAAILNVEVAKQARDTGLPEDEVISLLQKEAKKRQESADLFAQGGNVEKQQAELMEKEVIARFLPAQLSEEETAQFVEKALQETGATTTQDMGRVIAAVKASTGAAGDGSIIARLVKERLQ